MRFFKYLGIFLLLLLVGTLAYAGWVFRQLRSQNIQDLGVRYTAADYDSAVKTKAGVIVPDDPSLLFLGSKFRTEGSQKIDQVFSDAEISAIQNISNEKHGPFKQVQIHFLGGNQVEASGVVIDPRVPKTGPVYVKGSLVQTGPRSFDISGIQELRVGDYKVPAPIAQQAKAEFTQYVNGILADIEGLNVEKVEIQDGKVHFTGSVPKKVISLEDFAK